MTEPNRTASPVNSARALRQSVRLHGAEAAVLWTLGKTLLGKTLILVLLGCCSLRSAEPDFATEVQPIFRERCESCHGERRQRGGLRLDHGASALRGGDSGPAIRPGDSQGSELLGRVTSEEKRERMPPKGERLSAAEVRTLRRWIDAGAEWPPTNAEGEEDVRVASDHWAFRAPRRQEPPRIESDTWSLGAIDRWVLARLVSEGMSPSPEADRRTLLRRLSLDLRGLPPEPGEVDAFLADDEPEAWEKQVDRLLASPAWGEHRARRWLDLARYGDTNGFEKDRPRSMWPWRDWVIAAYNRDLPFDEFSTEQLAGDLLPEASEDQVLATGFHRNTMINEEGGVDVEQFRWESIVDRVATTGTVWLGLTVGCAQCHTHKFDPLTQHEYYGLFAFFNNCDELEVPVESESIRKRRQAMQGEIETRVATLAEKYPGDRESDFRAWVHGESTRASDWSIAPVRSLRSERGATADVLADGSILISGDYPNRDNYLVDIEVPLERVTALRLEALPDPSLPDGGPGRAVHFSRGDFLLSEIEARLLASDGTKGKGESLRFASASHSHASSKRSASLALDGVLDTGWAIGADQRGKSHRAVFVLERPLEGQRGRTLRVRLVQHYIHQQTLGRFRIALTADDSAIAVPYPAAVESKLASLRAGEQTAPAATQDVEVERWWLRHTPALEAEQKAIARLEARLPKFPTSLVFSERRPTLRRPTRLHHRGEFLSPRDPVEPGLPAVLPGLVIGEEGTREGGGVPDRLDFAEWLFDARNPLVARVAVNRHWQEVFGRGLVATSDDFGTQGDLPSHPELLDWLAVEYRERGWSTKSLLRSFALSATYRQAARVSEEALERDPENRLLARAPRFRLPAESIRDTALSAAGLLSRSVAGPSVFPPQPPGITEQSFGALKWTVSTGPDRYRRGLYTFWKRTTPYPAATTFDAPTAETCCVRRSRSNTPLQALTLLNDEVWVEAARALGRLLVTHVDAKSVAPASRDGAAVRGGFLRTLSRPPRPAELDRALRFVMEQRARIENGEIDAAAICGIAADKNAEPFPQEVADRAAWTLLARALLNLDEAITRE